MRPNNLYSPFSRAENEKPYLKRNTIQNIKIECKQRIKSTLLLNHVDVHLKIYLSKHTHPHTHKTKQKEKKNKDKNTKQNKKKPPKSAVNFLVLLRVVTGVKNPYVLLKLYQTLILPILDCCSPVWNVHKNCNMEKLEQIQHCATRMILCQRRGEQQYQDRLKL